MAAAGMELLADARETAVVGFSEVVGRLPALRRAYRALRTALRRERPAVLVLIDFPGMNMRLARIARRAGVPVVYFIPPQIWAWRARRVHAIRRRVSLVLAVFPFERALYRSAGVRAEFIGHPVLDGLATAPTRETARRELSLDPRELLVGLLPGSRPQEVDRMLPLLTEAARRLAATRPEARFLVALAPTVDAAAVARRLGEGLPVRIVQDRTYAVMRAADLLLVTSGTATLEAALLGTPMVVCYRVSRLTEALGRRLLRVPWISLVNIVLGRAVVPEIFQRRDLSPARVAEEALRLLATPGALEAQRDAFRELAGQLGEPGVGDRAARLVLAAASGA
jgi:lipid-A-disaccharide synthase